MSDKGSILPLSESGGTKFQGTGKTEGTVAGRKAEKISETVSRKLSEIVAAIKLVIEKIIKIEEQPAEPQSEEKAVQIDHLKRHVTLLRDKRDTEGLSPEEEALLKQGMDLIAKQGKYAWSEYMLSTLPKQPEEGGIRQNIKDSFQQLHTVMKEIEKTTFNPDKEEDRKIGDTIEGFLWQSNFGLSNNYLTPEQKKECQANIDALEKSRFFEGYKAKDPMIKNMIDATKSLLAERKPPRHE